MNKSSRNQSGNSPRPGHRPSSGGRLLSRAVGDLLVLALVSGAVLLAAVRGTRASPTPWYYPKDAPGESMDTDGDGVPDAEDRCPLAPGAASCAGCPQQMCDQVRQQGGTAWLGSGPDAGECWQAWYGGPIPPPVVASASRRVLLMGAREALTDVSLWSEGNFNLRLASMNLRRWNGALIREFPPFQGAGCGVRFGAATLSAAQFNQLVQDGGFDIEVSYELSCSYCDGDSWGHFAVAWQYDGVGGPPPVGSDDDADGVPLERDRCPLIAGRHGCADGCPLNACGLCGLVGTGDPDGDGAAQCLDSDGDTVPDWQDRCPLIAGDVSCEGCPAEVCQLPTPRMSLFSVGTSVWVVRGGVYNEILEDYRFVPVRFANSQTIWISNSTIDIGPVRARIITEVGSYPGEYMETQLSDIGGVGTVNFGRLALDGCGTASTEVEVPLSVFESGTRTGLIVQVSGFGAPYWCGEETRLAIEYFGPAGPPASGSDGDQDGSPIERDNCPHLANPDQRDCDGDGIGDRCAIAWGAEDLDGGGIPDRCQITYGDFDLDGEVTMADVSYLLLVFGDVGPPFGDFDGDDIITMADVSIMLMNFGPVPF